MSYKHPGASVSEEEHIEAPVTPRTATVRVASVPAAHPYVAAITPPDVQVLPDPTPPGAARGQWWPPQVLEPAWLERNAGSFDVVHVHFGLESLPLDTVRAAIDVLGRLGRPLVYTVHDLENPQLGEQTAHRRVLDAVIPAADRLITLTPSAADEISARWHRPVTVIPHPTLLRDEPPTGSPSASTRLGVHLRDLRPNIDGVGTVATLVRAIAGLRAEGADVEAVVRLNERVRDESVADTIRELASAHEGVRLERGARQSDDELARWLSDLDACVLPYRHGTHSGWAELCFDLAVPTIAPRVGHIAAQHPGEMQPFEIGDPLSLARAALAATTPARSRPGSSARVEEVSARRRQRLAERAEVRAAHASLYRSVLTGSAAA